MGEVTRIVIAHGERELDGVVRPGESWAHAADRVSATVSGDPHPVDLSGPVKRFVIDDLQVTLRAMSRGDLADVAKWRSEPHVHRWWHGDGQPSLAGVTEAYGPRIDGMTPVRMWVVEVQHRPVGFVQDYRIADEPAYAEVASHPDAIGLDFAIGDPAWVGRGLGARMLWTWMAKTRHRFPEATHYFAAPEVTNAASIRMLEKVGFVPGEEFVEPDESGGDRVRGCSLDVRTVLG